ncbi:MAG: pyridoxamine 5'-phosphate oxidase [Pseudomonadota bacterium]
MTDRSGVFAGDDPFAIARAWLSEAEASEINDPNAMSLATVDADGMPNVRIVLLKEIEADDAGDGAFIFFTNYISAKAQELDGAGRAAFNMHWKTLRRQIRVRGTIGREDGPQADEYYNTRSLKSRLGAWASKQSEPLESRDALMAELDRVTAEHGESPPRPPFWGAYRIKPLEIEFWADGEARLHDRFVWRRSAVPNVGETAQWTIQRLNP